MAQKKKITDKVDKRYRAKITIPGIEKPVYVSAKTKKELEQRKKETIEQLITGVKSNDRPFVEIVVDWWKNEKLPTLSHDGTIGNYRTIINLYILTYFNRNKLTKAVTVMDLQSCLNQSSGKSESHIVILKYVLKHSYRYAVKLGIVPYDITTMLESPTHAEPSKKDFLTDDQTKRFLSVAAEHEYGLSIYLLYYLGLRVGEMLALKWGDIDFDNGLVHVQRSVSCNTKLSAGKTKAANRYVPIPSPLMVELRKNRDLPDNFIITNFNSNLPGHMMTYNTYLYIWRQMLYQAGLATLSEKYLHRSDRLRAESTREPSQFSDFVTDLTPHWLRHNYVSLLYDAGVDAVTATRIVGHSSYQITADIYTHISNERIKKTSVNLDTVFSKVAERLPGITTLPNSDNPQTLTV